MKEFEIVRITKFKVEADFEDEAIQKCKDNKWESSQSKFVRMHSFSGEAHFEKLNKEAYEDYCFQCQTTDDEPMNFEEWKDILITFIITY